MAAISIPVLQIVFFLATMFLPAGTKTFSAGNADQKITWTQKWDGNWSATSAKGVDMGVWAVKDSQVSVTKDGQTSTTDISSFAKVETAADGTKTASVRGAPLTVSTTTDGKILFSQEAGMFERPVTITTTK